MLRLDVQFLGTSMRPRLRDRGVPPFLFVEDAFLMSDGLGLALCANMRARALSRGEGAGGNKAEA